MANRNFHALNFFYLLLEFYKELNISEDELLIVLMIAHILEQNDKVVTPEILEMKTNFSKDKIDKCLTNLYKRKYINFEPVDAGMSCSLEPLKKIVCKQFEKNIFSEEEFARNEELNSERDKLYDLFSRFFKRKLSPVEISHIDDWLKNSIPTKIIINALKDAENENNLNFNHIESLIQIKFRDEQ